MCPDLGTIDNGLVFFADSMVGSAASYRCSPGFMLIGNDRRTCNPDGLWSGTEPFCLGRCESCALREAQNKLACLLLLLLLLVQTCVSAAVTREPQPMGCGRSPTTWRAPWWATPVTRATNSSRRARRRLAAATVIGARNSPFVYVSQE